MNKKQKPNKTSQIVFTEDVVQLVDVGRRTKTISDYINTNVFGEPPKYLLSQTKKMFTQDEFRNLVFLMGDALLVPRDNINLVSLYTYTNGSPNNVIYSNINTILAEIDSIETGKTTAERQKNIMDVDKMIKKDIAEFIKQILGGKVVDWMTQFNKQFNVGKVSVPFD
jgi:hypothetical protein